MPSVPKTRRRPQPRCAPEAVHTCRADGTRQRRRTVAESLRETIRRVEEGGSSPGPHLPVGAAGIDRVLPGGGLRLGCVHEVAGDEAATGFCAVLLARCLRGTQDDRAAPALLWLSRDSDLYVPGLVRYGVGAGRLLFVSSLKRDEDVHWAMEEALHCPAVGAVVAETGRVGLAASRRLMLAAEGREVLGLALSRGSCVGGRHSTGVRSAFSRWRVTAVQAGNCARQAGGRTGWREEAAFPHRSADHSAEWLVQLLHCRGGRPAEWLARWTDGDWCLSGTTTDRHDAPTVSAMRETVHGLQQSVDRQPVG